MHFTDNISLYWNSCLLLLAPPNKEFSLIRTISSSLITCWCIEGFASDSLLVSTEIVALTFLLMHNELYLIVLNIFVILGDDDDDDDRNLEVWGDLRRGRPVDVSFLCLPPYVLLERKRELLRLIGDTAVCYLIKLVWIDTLLNSLKLLIVDNGQAIYLNIYWYDLFELWNVRVVVCLKIQSNRCDVIFGRNPRTPKAFILFLSFPFGRIDIIITETVYILYSWENDKNTIRQI